VGALRYPCRSALAVLALMVGASGHAAERDVAGTEIGFGLFQQRCMGCHGNPAVERAPTPAVIREMPPERIYAALSTGSMRAQAASLTDHDKRMMATFLSGRPLGSAARGDAAHMAHRCRSNPPLADPRTRPGWNGWGVDVTNARFQTAAAAGLSASQVPHLHLRWAFGYPTGLSAFGQPSIVSDRVFVGTDIGYVYSLNARTGCVYWSFKTRGSVRTAVAVAPVKGVSGASYAAYFGDAHANAYAIDAHSGKLLWVRKLDDNFVARVTGAPTAHEGRVYFPLSSSEEYSGASLDYACCTARGAVVALDGASGGLLWKAYVVDTPRPTRKNSRGVQLYAPSGGSIWDAPTIDALRSALYVGTGDGQTLPVPKTTDAVMAFDLETGRTLWFYQTRTGDAWLGGCQLPATRTDNCPEVIGPDWDIGNSPILQRLPDGARRLIVGTKDARVIALDPDHQGSVVWTTVLKLPEQPGTDSKLPRGPGIFWGGAADGENVYYGLRAGGVVAVRLADGRELWSTAGASPAGATNEAAVSAIPGVVFAGGSDGIVRALASTDGHILWEYATARDFKTVNAVAARGGAIDSAGPTIANGMLFIGSGYGVTGTGHGNVLLAFSAR